MKKFEKMKCLICMVGIWFSCMFYLHCMIVLSCNFFLNLNYIPLCLFQTHWPILISLQEPYTNPLASISCWHVHCEECWLRTLVRQLFSVYQIQFLSFSLVHLNCLDFPQENFNINHSLILCYFFRVLRSCVRSAT